MKKFVWLVFPVFLFIAACSPEFFYQDTKQIPSGIWRYQDTLNYTFNITDTASLYNLYVEFEHADTFAYQNLYLKLYTLFPDGKRLSKPCSFDFFNPQGSPNGTCSSHKCVYRSMLQSNAFFNKPGSYIVTIEQFMRRDSVPGIQSVGFLIEKTAQNKHK